jgi:hypothetical protein
MNWPGLPGCLQLSRAEFAPTQDRQGLRVREFRLNKTAACVRLVGPPTPLRTTQALK